MAKRQGVGWTYPGSLSKHHSGKAMSTGSDKTRRAAHEALIHDGNLQEVLGERSSFQIIVVRLAHFTQEAHRTRPSEFKLQHAQHEAFGLEDLIGSVASVDHVDDLAHGGAVDLLIFGSDEDRRRADELQLAQGDDLARKETIDVVDTQEERFRKKGESMVDLHQPIHQHGAH